MSVRDVLHTQALILKRRWGYACLCLALYVGFVLALAIMNPSGSLFGNTFLVLGLVVAPGILPFTLLMVYLRLQRASQRHEGIFAVTQSRLTPRGVEADLKGSHVSMPWSAFGAVLISPRVALLFLRDSPNHLIIPRAKLVHPEEWDLLVEYLQIQFRQL